MHYYIGPIQIYSGAEVSHTNRCRSVRWTLRHYNLVPKCPGAEVSRERLWCFDIVGFLCPVTNTAPAIYKLGFLGDLWGTIGWRL